MAISVNSNPAAAAANAYERAQASAAKAVRQLSSGRRIEAAADDAAGLASSVRLTSQIRGLGVAARNAQDAISLTDTASGALASVTGNLQRLRELSVEAANATPSASDRAALQLEAAQLVDEIDRVGRSTAFNGQLRLDGSFGPTLYQVGADVGQSIALGALASVRASALGNVDRLTSTLAGTTLTAASTVTGPGQLVINGIDIWQGLPIGADAKELAAAIAAAGIAGLTAQAAPTVAVGTYAASGGTDGEFSVDGQGSWTFHHGALAQAAAVQDTVDLVNNVKPNLIGNGGFEASPVLPPPGYFYSPGNQPPWSFGAGTGVTGNGTAFTSGNAAAPEGQTTAFVQMNGNLSQTFDVAAAGSYDLGFQMVQRANFGFPQTVSVRIDGQLLSQIPSPGGWTPYSLTGIALAAGTHTLTFAGSSSQDGTAFIDDVRLIAAGPGPPRPVRASANGSGVTLTAADGSNIRLKVATGSPAALGLGGIAYGVASDGMTYSRVDLAYTGQGGLTVTGSQAAALGLAGAPVVSAPNLLSALDISSVGGANTALDTIDAALASVDAARASLGATANRLAATIGRALAAAADMSASRSRIVDADYGETASDLVRATILQQAGLAMVAQANLHRQDVLRLLAT